MNERRASGNGNDSGGGWWRRLFVGRPASAARDPELRVLIDAIQDPFFVCESDETVSYASPQLETELLGFRHGLLGQKIWKAFGGTVVPAAVRAAFGLGALVGGDSTGKIDFGSDRHFSFRASLLRGSRRVVGIFHDISDLKRADRVRVDFVANVSHELRTPLTSIKGYADTLAQDLQTGVAANPAFVQAIQRNADRLMSLVHDLLDLSALESTEAIAPETVPTREITERVLGTLRKAFEAKRQAFSVEYGAPEVLADPKRLEQVLVNLLDNASKYTPEGRGIRVEWESGSGGGGGAGVVLKVIDEGPGIAPEHHSRLFERFYRVDRARSRELGGTGLGLAIVKHIMTRHGGSVWVESALGRGTTFACRFPGG